GRDGTVDITGGWSPDPAWARRTASYRRPSRRAVPRGARRMSRTGCLLTAGRGAGALPDHQPRGADRGPGCVALPDQRAHLLEGASPEVDKVLLHCGQGRPPQRTQRVPVETDDADLLRHLATAFVQRA